MELTCSSLTMWDKLVVDVGDMTIREFVQYFEVGFENHPLVVHLSLADSRLVLEFISIGHIWIGCQVHYGGWQVPSVHESASKGEGPTEEEACLCFSFCMVFEAVRDFPPSRPHLTCEFVPFCHSFCPLKLRMSQVLKTNAEVGYAFLDVVCRNIATGEDVAALPQVIFHLPPPS